MKKQFSQNKLFISWDDGHPLDYKSAELLNKYNIPGIFYIPIINPERKVMTKSQIRQVSSFFEIGGHTYSHADLTSIPLEEARKEISLGKRMLEDIIGKKVEKFCYPKGKFNNVIKELVKGVGFKEARTARIVYIGANNDPFETNPNLHIYNHMEITYLAHCLKNWDFKTAFKVSKLHGYDFIDVAKQLFTNGFHIWGHSWELEEKGLWKVLEKFLIFVTQQN